MQRGTPGQTGTSSARNGTAERFHFLKDHACYFLFDNNPAASKPNTTPMSKPI